MLDNCPFLATKESSRHLPELFYLLCLARAPDTSPSSSHLINSAPYFTNSLSSGVHWAEVEGNVDLFYVNKK